MKKILLFLLVLSFMFSLSIFAACGDFDKNKSGENTEEKGEIWDVDEGNEGNTEEQTPEVIGGIKVSDFMLDDNRRYTGTLLNGLPEGSGELVYVNSGDAYTGNFGNGVFNGTGKYVFSNGITFEGVFEEGVAKEGKTTTQRTYGLIWYEGKMNGLNVIDGSVAGEGKYAYSNGMFYEGGLINAHGFSDNAAADGGTFHGNGIFDWSTPSETGWLYEGEFKNGTMEGCFGKITFTEARTGNSGMQYFEGEMDGFPNIKRDQTGKGKILYDNGSYYEGDLKHTSDGRYIRKGEGVNYFEDGLIPYQVLWNAPDGRLFAYKGSFDEEKMWIYGNGVFYFTDEAGNPVSYMKGCWRGFYGKAWDESKSAFEESVILQGWKDKEEILYSSFVEKRNSILAQYMVNTGSVVIKTFPQNGLLFMGDSYLDFWKTAVDLGDGTSTGGQYATDMADYSNHANIGIGGSKFDDWISFYEEMVLPFNPAQIVIHLSVNDINNNYPIDDIYSDMTELVGKLHENLPDAQIYLMTYEPSKAFPAQWERGKQYNALLRDFCENTDYATMIATANIFVNAAGTAVKDGYNCSDGLHLSDEGYNVWVAEIKRMISGGEPLEPTKTYVTDLMLDSNRKYTGYMVDGLPNDENGTLAYLNSGDTYVGNFKNGIITGKGKLTYSNGMFYEGDFVNGQFHGTGVFDWSMPSSVGWLYEGEFQNGTMAGCVGKLTLIAGRTGGNGICWLVGEMSGFPAIKDNQDAIGKIVYDDGSWYEGEIRYTTNFNALRYGEGEQNFFNTSFSSTAAGAPGGYKIYKYVGTFDQVNYNWMKGDGIVYFAEEDGTPAGYITGTWSGFTRVGVYTKTPVVLDEEWEGTQEFEYANAYDRKFEYSMQQYGDTDMSGKMLMIGASQFDLEFFTQAVTLMEDEAIAGRSIGTVDIAIGGTTADWWNGKMETLTSTIGEPEIILLNIIGNEIGRGDSVEAAKIEQVKLMTALNEAYPNAKIYQVGYTYGPYRYQSNDIGKIREVCDYMEEWWKDKDYGAWIDLTTILFGSVETEISDDVIAERYGKDYRYLKVDMFADGLHFTKAAFQIWGTAIKQKLIELHYGE